MPTITPTSLFSPEIFSVFLKGGTLLILVFYAIFALVVVRQVDLMGKTLITKVSPVIKAFSIFHAGFALGLILLAWGML